MFRSAPWATAACAAAFLALSIATCLLAPADAADVSFRPPAVPLVTSDPYLSIWSDADRLTDDVTRHWTRRPHPLVSLIRVDGKTFRLMGTDPADAPALPQTSVRVLPTRSIYEFDDGHVHVTLTFMTPALPHDLNVLSRPLSYITWEARSVDGAVHEAEIYDSTSGLLAVNRPQQAVEWARGAADGLNVMRIGSSDQTYFQPSGDDTRIDWGYAYAAAPSLGRAAIGGDAELIAAFEKDGTLPAADDARQPRAASDDEPVMAFAFPIGKLGAAPISRHVIVAYDEVYSIDWFGAKLRPYWRRNGATADDMLAAAERDYRDLGKRCEDFDAGLMKDLALEGGDRYAQIAALAYRQTFAACGLAADANKQPLLLTKENTSNGDLATVDVIFPMDPMMLFFSPTLAKATVAPLLAYSASAHWRFPNAPHDLGLYPVAFGRDEGGEAMPVEESGNMLILCDAISQEDGNTRFVDPYWPQLSSWAKFLEQYGLDPENQLCTDDFMGHLAHNANLSVKAILALAAYGDMCRMRGDLGDASRYAALAKADAAHWQIAAADGGHTKLAFDRPGTWSQKYNLVWDQILGLGVFPASVAASEIAQYKSCLRQYGVPLDSRTHLTKTDWSVWSASMAVDRSDFEAIVNPIWDYLSTTAVRDPLADSYVTDNPGKGGMHARPVAGGVFIKMLADRAMRQRYAAGDKAIADRWAPLPKMPRLVDVIPSSQHVPQMWRYTTDAPASGWMNPEFDDSAWKEGPAGFGTPHTPNAVIGTRWDTGDIWLRRTVTLPSSPLSAPAFWVYHDEDVDIYVDGVLAAHEAGFVSRYELLDIASRKARDLLKPGASVTLAVHCCQTTGGQNVDVGIVQIAGEE